MAPTLRSSASNTPTGKTGAAIGTPSSTPRKTPQCTKCKRPRAGHPRQGCPYVDSPLREGTPDTQPPDNIEDALQSMRLESPTRDHDETTKATLRSRDELTDEDEASRGKKVVRWQDTLLTTPTKPKGKNAIFARSPMPGTLCTPSPETSFLSTEPSFAKEESVPNEASISSVQSLPPRPLVRSMSLEQRTAFVEELNQASKATVYILPKADIPAIRQSASNLGFHSRTIGLSANTAGGTTGDGHDSDGWLILGRDGKAVQNLFDSVQADLKSKKGSGVGFRAVAGGAVVGAVATWTGLAFS